MMLTPLIHGVAAGAVGTAVLNTVTYIDMTVRDRPSSDVPAETAERVTDLAGVTLADEDAEDDAGQNRKQGAGALMGYLAGYGVAAVYGVLRPRLLAGVPRSVAGVGLAAAATAATVAPYSALGVSDPRTWGAKSWAADIIPHLCYGWATAAAFDALQGSASTAKCP
jgi:hypothetical protein